MLLTQAPNDNEFLDVLLLRFVDDDKQIIPTQMFQSAVVVKEKT